MTYVTISPKEQGRAAYWSGCDDPEAHCPYQSDDSEQEAKNWLQWFEGYADAKKLAES